MGLPTFAIIFRRSQAETFRQSSKARQLSRIALSLPLRQPSHRLIWMMRSHVSACPATTTSQLSFLVWECRALTVPAEEVVMASPAIHSGMRGRVFMFDEADVRCCTVSVRRCLGYGRGVAWMRSHCNKLAGEIP